MKKLGSKLEREFGAEIFREDYSATVEVPPERQIDFLEAIIKEPSMRAVQEEENIFTVYHEFE